jgi:hypothetical protein
MRNFMLRSVHQKIFSLVKKNQQISNSVAVRRRSFPLTERTRKITRHVL